MAAGVPRQPRQPSPAEGEEQRQGKNRHGKNTKTQNPHSFSTKGTIRGNAHDNRCLISLFPFFDPQGEKAWEVLMLVKDIVELVVALRFTKETRHVHT